ncbi:hypothetical protein G6N82_07665 [Altererythrobacter sp. BO-6]|uniref:hypothetical protein n=1 Tax=Altererythrobacter sp. BO-6 TaxID=2604537 RepID=UPI0013E1FC8B|nr:hypothetical protein [Altererythrobacter sp. BO-6]QIG54047.1 hypothetical protein G6N82_07665 [Altererythrobacter sp. BO-6]
MGYELHIHRRKDFWESGSDISLAEWQDLCAADPSLTIVGEIVGTTAEGMSLAYANEGLAIWARPAGFLARLLNRPPGEVPFDFRDGAIIVKSPDNAIIKKMAEIAALLDARVQGDDGEFYLADGTLFYE